MKKINYFIIVSILIFISCSNEKDTDDTYKKENLGLTEGNIYPEYPVTFQFLGSNQWIDTKSGDTLKISRRDRVSDDSGDELVYTFLVKKDKPIVPLNVRRISFDAHIEPPRFGMLMFNKKITNFRLQEYIENKVLACEIVTPNGDYFLQNAITDRMWIKLDD